MIEITKNDLLNKYGEVKLVFSHYYKYVFTFQSTLPDGRQIKALAGGMTDNIYKFEVLSGESYTLDEINPKECRILDGADTVELFQQYRIIQ